MEKIQKQAILNDLAKKIVLLVGPRQAGKTLLAKSIAHKFHNSIYLNYDQVLDKKIMNNQSVPHPAMLHLWHEYRRTPLYMAQ